MTNKVNESTWGYLVHVYLGVMKGCAHYMTPDERLVMDFVMSRTLAYKKKVERIPIRHFTDGVVSRDGDIVAPRVGISKTNILRALKHLKAKGLLIARQDSEGGSNYLEIVDPDEIDHETVQTYIQAEQNIDLNKRLVSVENTREASPPLDQGVVHRWTN